MLAWGLLVLLWLAGMLCLLLRPSLLLLLLLLLSGVSVVLLLSGLQQLYGQHLCQLLSVLLRQDHLQQLCLTRAPANDCVAQLRAAST